MKNEINLGSLVLKLRNEACFENNSDFSSEKFLERGRRIGKESSIIPDADDVINWLFDLIKDLYKTKTGDIRPEDQKKLVTTFPSAASELRIITNGGGVDKTPTWIHLIIFLMGIIIGLLLD